MKNRIVRFAVEYTDTFGGQANYCWCNRYTFDAPDTISDVAVMRRAKALCGLNGVRGRSSSFGDVQEFRPYGSCTVMFVSYDGEAGDDE